MRGAAHSPQACLRRRPRAHAAPAAPAAAAGSCRRAAFPGMVFPEPLTGWDGNLHLRSVGSGRRSGEGRASSLLCPLPQLKQASSPSGAPANVKHKGCLPGTGGTLSPLTVSSLKRSLTTSLHSVGQQPLGIHPLLQLPPDSK